jgi:hypothetical protein
MGGPQFIQAPDHASQPMVVHENAAGNGVRRHIPESASGASDLQQALEEVPVLRQRLAQILGGRLLTA